MNKTTRPGTTATEAQLIERAKEYAERNYENGFDTFVECYEHDDWRKLVHTPGGKLMSWTQIKNVMDSLGSVWQEREADAAYHRRQAIGDPDKTPVATVQLVKDCPEVETRLRQALKDTYGQSYLFDMHLEMTVPEAQEYIAHLQHLND